MSQVTERAYFLSQDEREDAPVPLTLPFLLWQLQMVSLGLFLSCSPCRSFPPYHSLIVPSVFPLNISSIRRISKMCSVIEEHTQFAVFYFIYNFWHAKNVPMHIVQTLFCLGICTYIAVPLNIISWRGGGDVWRIPSLQFDFRNKTIIIW